MAGLVIQEHACPRPRPLKNGNKFTTLAVYQKLASSFSSSASAQDLRIFEEETEKYNSSSPRGVIEACIKGLEHESGSPQTNTSNNKKLLSNPRRSSGWQRFLKLWKKKSIKRLPSFPPLYIPKISRRKSTSGRENEKTDRCEVNSAWKNFNLAELQAATNNFSQENVIGKGGYAEVYKGCLPNGQLVAIKRLNRGMAEEHLINFLSEIGIIAHVKHPNAGKMIGYGVEGGTYLVLQLSSLGSLGSLLRGSKEKLDWGKRYKIILGIADGLLYLHENCQRRIIHRDIKADNILLTEDFEAQICDFGLSKWLPKQWSHHNVTKFEGTFGYFAPEYFMHGIIDEKTDVYSFGVLLLEIITGRQALDDSRKSLVLWANPLLDKNEVMEVVDPCLRNKYDTKEMDSVILTATLCVEQNPVLRPRMSQVIAILRGYDKKPNCLNNNRKQILQRTYSEELLDVEEYNSTKYLINLKK